MKHVRFRGSHWVLGMSLAAGIVASAGRAAAQEQAPAERPFESSAGLKLLAGGNLWTAPSNVPGGYDGLGFAAEGGGFGWGGALYYEARFIQHLGLELDLGYDSSTLQRNVTLNGVVETTEKVTASGPRVSLLAKGIVPTPFGRLWAGLGPELVFPSSVDASLEAEGQQVQDTISAKKQSSTMLAFALGLVVHVGESFEIPVDLRAAKNLSQESDWQDRVEITPPNRYEVTVQSSWDFRLGAGLGYRF